MTTYFQKITNQLYAFLLWDDTWDSYNNCYILIKNDEVILIDSGKKEHFHQLETAINSIGVDKFDISKFLATHGHVDHIGGYNFLENTEGYRDDSVLLPDNIRDTLKLELPNNGETAGYLTCVLLGHHTKGSVALYCKDNKAMFCGDHVCFFGERLVENKVVDKNRHVRETFKMFVSDWGNNEMMKKQYNHLFINGLREMNKFDIEYLCTGHGAILEGDINHFISELLMTNTDPNIK